MSQQTHLEIAAPTNTICGPARVQCLGIGDDHNWKIDRSNPSTFDPIVTLLKKGTKHLWMPRPTKANGRFVTPPEFGIECTRHGVAVMGACDADGAFVPKGDAFAITSADCPTVVLWDANSTHVCCLHAARESLLDRALVEHNVPSRDYFSVVHDALFALRGQGIQLHDVRMHVFCGVRKGFRHPRNHPTHGAYNKKLLAWCEENYAGSVTGEHKDEIDLYAVACAQAVEYGVPHTHVYFDTIDTFRDTTRDGLYQWASALDPTRRHKRNLVLVQHL